MSLSRSEEMHRLTENVYKVSFSEAPSVPPVCFRPEQGTGPGTAGMLGRPSVGHRWPRPPRVLMPAAARAVPEHEWTSPPRRRCSVPTRCLSVRRDGAVLGLGCSATRSGPLHSGVRGTASGGGVDVAGCRGRAPCACLARWHRGALPGAVMPASGHFFLNRLSLSTTPSRLLMFVAQSGRSSADRLDGWTDNPSSYVTAEGED